MNVAIIIAGGIGSRMGQDVPKQFIDIFGKPVIIYTLETFEHHPLIDAIAVVCLDGWQEILRSYSEQYGISKLRWIVKGGSTGQESIRNGVYALEKELSDDDTVIIHDGVRPMLDVEVLTDVIRVCDRYGNAVSSMPYNEQIFLIDDDNPQTTTRYIPRETLRRVSTPQAYRYAKLLHSYRKAFSLGIGISGSSYTNTMMVELGETLHFASGSDKNLKLTTPENLETFKAYLTIEGKGRQR